MKFLKRLLVDRWGGREDDHSWRRSQAPLDPKAVESVCLLHLNDKLGDAVIDSLLVDALAKLHPEIPVFVGTTAGFERYWRSHPHVREVAVFPPSKGRSALGRVFPARRAARPWRGRFDVVVSFESFAQPDHFALLRALGARTVVGFDKNRFRLFAYSLDEGRFGVEARPIASKIAAVLRVFGDETDLSGMRSHVPLEPDGEREAQAIVGTPGDGLRLFIHTYGTGGDKRLSSEKVASILRTFREAGHRGPVWVGVPKGQREAYGMEGVAVVEPTESAFGLFALIAEMDLVVAPDTSVGHIAAALGKPQAVLFPGAANLPRVWSPRNERCVVLVAPPGETVESIEIADAARTVLAWARVPTAR